ncbi:MAG: glycosyltransferase family 4 protein [Acidobacteriota bacterium]
MRMLSITAGAGGMYCGSCLRDNALAAELRSQGHDVLLVPLYTPTLTDEPNVSEGRVFFGGISVYLQQHVPLFRKTPWLLDRLWDSSFAIQGATRFSISTDTRRLGELTVSMLRGEEGFQGKEIYKFLHWLRSQPVPDIVSLPNSLLIGLAAPLRQALKRPVFCTLQGEDLFLEGLPEPYKQTALELIQKSIEDVEGFMAVSDYYAGFMSQYLGIPPAKMHVVPLGINLQGYGPEAPSRTNPFTIGYFARVAPEKGLHNLCETYRRLRHSGELRDARLEAAGYLGPEHRGYLREIEAKMKAWGLEGEFHYRGALDRKGKIAFLQTLDVLSVPSRYREPKGIYLLEAMACGVPVVQPRHGAFPEILEKTGGGILVDSEDGKDVADGIMTLWRDPAFAEELGRKGRDGVHRQYSVGQMAEGVLELFGEKVAARECEGQTAATKGTR